MSGISYPHWKGGRDGVSGLNQQRARTLLRELDQSLKAAGLLSGTRSMRYADGAYITASITGDVATLRVEQIQPRRRTPKVYKDPVGFVVTARTSDLLSGVIPLFPQQIITEVEDGWSTRTYDDTFSTGRSDGTYKSEFNDGVKYAGNLDWSNPEGVRLYWYGPSRRYWFDSWRRPDAQYGQWVFLNGQILLDTQEHGAAAQKYVLGAALVGDQLYVMQATINDFELDMDTLYPAPRNYTWVSPPYPDGDTVLRLCRYTITEDVKQVGKAARYKVVPDSYESLWNITRRGYVNPWFFNNDATVCETFAMPNELRSIAGMATESSTSPYTVITTPSSSSEHAVLTRDPEDDSVVFNTSTLTAIANGNAAAYSGEIAVEYTADGTRCPVSLAYSVPGGDINVSISVPGVSPVALVAESDALGTYRMLLYVDAKRGAIITAGVDIFSAENYTRSVVLQTATAGTYSKTITADTFITNTPIGRYNTNSEANTYGGRGFNRRHGVRYFFVPIVNHAIGASASDPVNVSPLYALSGVYLYTSTRVVAPLPGRRLGATIRVMPGAIPPFLFPTDQLAARQVYPGSTNPVVGTGAVFWFMLQDGDSSYLQGIDAEVSSASTYDAVDSLGYSIYHSIEIDSAGNMVAATSLPLAANRYHVTDPEATDGFGNEDGDFYRTVLNVSFSSSDSLQALTGVSGTEATLTYGLPVPDVYDARYTPIWQLGIWPVVGPRPTEE